MANLKLTRDQIEEAMWELPFADRASMLTLSIIKNHREPVAAVHALLELVNRMLMFYSTSQKYLVANKMRDIADKLEKVPKDEHA